EQDPNDRGPNPAMMPTFPLRPSNTDDEFSELVDGVASAAHWLKLPPFARVRPYVPLDHHGLTAEQTLVRELGGRLAGAPAEIVRKLTSKKKADSVHENMVLEF